MRLVLDTNIVLDWLVFGDLAVDALQLALDAERISLVTHQPALDELRRVLAYPQFELNAPEQLDVLQRYEALTEFATLPAGGPSLPNSFPRCRDPDDQHFLVLTYHVRAAALVTKDKELLRLQRRAAKLGLTILNPVQLRARL
jgi:putative PIN family toxin of toxin-antitoxin system